MVSTIDGGHYRGSSMAKKRRRRIWKDDEKRRIVAQTRVPGVSVSQVARRYDVNANMVFKWLREPWFKPLEVDLPSFLPVEVLPDASPGAAMAHSDAVALGSRIEITLSNGLSLCVSGAFVDPVRARTEMDNAAGSVATAVIKLLRFMTPPPPCSRRRSTSPAPDWPMPSTRAIAVACPRD
jgi:transposase